MRDIVAGDKLLRRIEWTTSILLALSTAGAWGLFSIRIAGGVLVGGVIAITSFQLLKWQLKKAFQRPGSVAVKGGVFATYYLRFLATMFVVFVVVYKGWADPLALLVGLSVVVSGITLVGGLEFFVLVVRKGEH